MSKFKWFEFNLTNDVNIKISAPSLDLANERFKLIFGEFLFSLINSVKVI